MKSIETGLPWRWVVTIKKSACLCFKRRFLHSIAYRAMSGFAVIIGGSSRSVCLAKISGISNVAKGSSVPEFSLWRAKIASCVFVNIKNGDCAV